MPEIHFALYKVTVWRLAGIQASGAHTRCDPLAKNTLTGVFRGVVAYIPYATQNKTLIINVKRYAIIQKLHISTRKQAIMEEQSNTGGRRGETSLRLSETANEALTKLTKEWKASSKKEAIEGMINYFKKLGISPLEEVPDTVGKRLEKRVDQVIAFIRQNEKIHREEIEKVLLFARQNPAGNNPAAGGDLATAADFVRMANVLVDINKACDTLQNNDQVLLKTQAGILGHLQNQNDMLTQRLAAYKDTSALYQVIKDNMQKYTDSVLADPQKAPQMLQNFILHFKKKLGIAAPPEILGG